MLDSNSFFVLCGLRVLDSSGRCLPLSGAPHARLAKNDTAGLTAQNATV